MTVPFRNLSFEDAGSEPGEADGWTFAGSDSVYAVAVFAEGSEVPNSVESFEGGWDGNEADLFSLPEESLTAALFDQIVPYETFSPSWDDGGDVWSWSRVAEAAASFYQGISGETFGNGAVPWNGGTCLAQFEESDLSSAGLENFESGWRSCEDDLSAFAPEDLEAATFGAGRLTDSVEDFEHVCGAFDCYADPATDRICTYVAHGLSDWTAIVFEAVGGALPVPLQAGRVYWTLPTIITDVFQVAAQYEGAAIDLLDAGSGTIRFRGAPSGWWGDVLP